MALVKYGSIITEIAGKLGGHIFQRTGAGHSVHTIQRPGLWPSARKLAQRNNFLRVVNAWKALIPGDITLWQAATIEYPIENSLHETIYLSGYSLFLMLNLNLLEAGFSIITTPQPPEPAQILTGISGQVGIGGGSFVIYCNETPVPGNMAYLIYAGYQAASYTTGPPGNNYKFIDHANPTDTFPFSILLEYSALFPDLLNFKPGNYIYCKIAVVHKLTGQRDITYNFAASIIA
jgi:hypothetical protein